MNHNREIGPHFTGHIHTAMANVSAQVFIWKASPSHEPRGLADDLRMITVRVAVDAIEHLAIAAFISALSFLKGEWVITHQMTAPMLFPGSISW